MRTPPAPTFSIPSLDPRGVYCAAYTIGGRRVFYSITSAGERLRETALDPDQSENDLVSELRRELDERDPPGDARRHLTVLH